MHLLQQNLSRNAIEKKKGYEHLMFIAFFFGSVLFTVGK